MPHNDLVDALYDRMTLGEKVHMANKLYKEDNIIPQRLRTDLSSATMEDILAEMRKRLVG